MSLQAVWNLIDVEGQHITLQQRINCLRKVRLQLRVKKKRVKFEVHLRGDSVFEALFLVIKHVLYVELLVLNSVSMGKFVLDYWNHEWAGASYYKVLYFFNEENVYRTDFLISVH